MRLGLSDFGIQALLLRSLPMIGSGRWRARRSGVKEERLAAGGAGDSRGAECAVGPVHQKLKAMRIQLLQIT